MKNIKIKIKLQIKAQEANPSPPIGPALGQHGVNIIEFCKQFNAKTKTIDKGTPIPVQITIYNNKKFDFITKTPTTTFLIKKITKIKKGSKSPKKINIGIISNKQIKKIAKIKIKDLNTKNINNAIKIITGTVKTMGITIKKEKKDENKKK